MTGRIREGAAVYGNRPGRWPHLPRPDDARRPRVALVEACLGDDAGLLRLVLDSDYDGVVLAAFGAGNVPRQWAEVVGEAAHAIPVGYASRIGAGSTWNDTYGFVGSEADLAARGMVAAGWLDPRKPDIDAGTDQPEQDLRYGSRRADVRETRPNQGRCRTGRPARLLCQSRRSSTSDAARSPDEIAPSM